MTLRKKLRSTFNLMCYLKKDKMLKNGEAPIYMRITVNGQVVGFSMQGTVVPSQWNQDKEKCKGNEDHILELNQYIEGVKTRLRLIHRQMEIDGQIITARKIKDQFLGVADIAEVNRRSLVEVHSEHNTRCKELLGVDYSQSTIYKFDTSLKHLQEFMRKKLKVSDIPMKDINENFIRNYEAFIKTEKRFSNNYAVKQIKIFKKITRIALANDWIQKDPFATIKFRIDEVHIEFLTLAEIQALIDKDLHCSRLSRVRDIFVFCCFTNLDHKEQRIATRGKRIEIRKMCQPLSTIV